MADALFVAAATNAVGTLTVDYLVKPVTNRFRYLFRFNKIVEELCEEKNRLTKEKTRVKEDVEEAKMQIQTQVIEKYVEDWLTEAENVLNGYQNLESEIQENKRCFGRCPNWSKRYRLSKKMVKTTMAIRKLVECSNFGRYGHRAALPGIELIESKGYVASRSLTFALNKIMEALKDDRVNMIGVWGMGGVGKTTLVKEVGNEAKRLQLVDQVILVVISQTPDIDTIQEKIADFLGLKFGKTTREGKAEELWLRLKNEEKVLIILDDVWLVLDLDAIGIPLGQYHESCKIILTTRNRGVCASMESQIVVSLGVLAEEEGWNLFKMKAELDEASLDIIEVAMKVSKECVGLPLAIVTLARALRSGDLDEWKSALKKLKSTRLMDIDFTFDIGAYCCLKMSYEHLRRETTKKCFLLCSLYPEDHPIDEEHLVRYAWGLGLYHDAGSIEQVRSKVLGDLQHLKDSNLLLEDDQTRDIKMHDVTRDVARWIASKEDNNLLTKQWVSEDESFKEKLEILLIDNNDSEIAIDDFEGMRKLKVLSLRSTSQSKGGFFSLNALKALKNLRALQLEGFNRLEGISALANLMNLEILKLHGSEFREPIDILGELKILRVLDMRHCKFSFRFPPQLIRRLVKLEELYLYDLTIQRSVLGVTKEEASVSAAILPDLAFLSQLAVLLLEVPSLRFPQGFGFRRLERYEIAINWPFYYWRCLEETKTTISTRSLRISERVPLDVVSELLQNVEILEVSNIVEKDISCLTDTAPGNVPVATILQNLKEVRIEECENLEVIFQIEKEDNYQQLLSGLKDLWLSELPNLENIWKIPTQHISLQNLEVVNLIGCGKLKSLFSFSLAQSLVRLQLLEIKGCRELKQIVKELEDDEQETMNFVKSPCFPELRAVEIYNCDNLDYIFPNFISPQSLPQLKRLLMQNLSQLKQIWSPAKQREEDAILQHQLQALPSLTELKVRRCPNLTDAAELGSARVHLEDVQLSKLKEASIINPKVLSLKKIRTQSRNLIPEVYGDGLNELTFLELGFCDSLEYLVDTTKEHVPDCALTNLVELSMGEMRGLKMLCNGLFPKHFLGNLKKLTVKRCDQLEELFTEENHAQIILSNLEHLELDSLPKLRWMLIGSAYYVSLQSLKVVNISRCQELRFLFSLSLVQSMVQLEQLQIEGCDRLEALFEDLESDGDCHDLHPPCLPRLLTLRISKCPRLVYVLPITVAQGLPQLQSVWVSNSPQVKQVFGATEEHDGVQHSIKLPCLERLELHNLTNLSSFCQQNYFLMAPALEILSVSATPQFKKCTIQRQVNNNSRLHFEGEILLNAKDLTLNRVMNQKSLIPDVVVEGLTSLKLKDCEDLECLADTTKENVPNRGMLPNLVELIMENMIGLKMLCKGQPPKGFLRNLEMLTVERCMDIVSLSPVAQNLQKLKLEDCEKLQEVFRIDDLLYSREDNHAQLLSNLDYLELVSVPELRWILKGPPQYVSLQSLKVVKITNCNKLESLFSASLTRSLRMLEELRISYCNRLEMVFTELESDEKTESNTLGVLNLKSMEIIECPSLKSVLPSSPAERLPGGFNFKLSLENMELGGLTWLPDIWKVPNQVVVTNLRELRVYDCNELTYIFPVMLIRNLPELRILKIWWCENLKQIIVNDDISALSSSQGHGKDGKGIEIEERISFPQLKELWLEGLPSLTSFSPVGYHLSFPSLDSLVIEDCSQMITSFTVDSTSCVHARTKASGPDDISPSILDTYWRSHEATSLPPYVEEP